jgi:hypothetical protein
MRDKRSSMKYQFRTAQFPFDRTGHLSELNSFRSFTPFPRGARHGREPQRV